MSENSDHPPAVSRSEPNDDNDGSSAPTTAASSLSHLLNKTDVDPTTSFHREDVSHPHHEGGHDNEEDESEEDDDEEHDESAEDYVAVGHEDALDFTNLFRRPPIRNRTPLDELHPFVQLLTPSNIDDCVKVEEAFPEHERCSREKFEYRLTKCPELSLGIFTLPVLGHEQPKSRPQLIAHIAATRTPAPFVTDESMDYPKDWKSAPGTPIHQNPEKAPGHHEFGGTIAVHSLAVAPEHQGKKVGSTLMKSYIQRIGDALIADRIALLTHEHLIPFYESLGFTNAGPSSCTFGGGGWTNMVIDLKKEKPS